MRFGVEEDRGMCRFREGSLVATTIVYLFGVFLMRTKRLTCFVQRNNKINNIREGCMKDGESECFVVEYPGPFLEDRSETIASCFSCKSERRCSRAGAFRFLSMIFACGSFF